MAIKITEDGNVKYENEPNVERDLLPNIREGGVTDIKIDGVSIVGQDGSAEIPIGTNTTAGLVKGGSNGVIIRNGGLLAIDPATDEIVKIGTNGRNPIVPGKQDVSTFYGLAKASGDTTQSQSSNPVGTYTDEAKAAIQTMLGVPSSDDIPEVPVQDVQVNGTSVLNNGVANVPMAGNNVWGVIRTAPLFGTKMVTSNTGTWLGIEWATSADIKSPSGSVCHAIVPYFQHESTFYGLARAAGDTTQSASSNAVGTYTDNAKAAIKAMLGVTDPQIVVEKINLSASEQSKTVSITKDSFNLFLMACPTVTQNNGLALYYNNNNASVAGGTLHECPALTVTKDGTNALFTKTSSAASHACYILKITTA